MTLPEKGKSTIFHEPAAPEGPGQKPGQKEESMKLNHLLKSLLLGLAVFVATSAFASNKGNFHVNEAIEVNGQQLPAGDYQVRWEGSGSNVELSFMKGKKEVLKATAMEVDLGHTASDDAAVTNISNGKISLSEIRFAGKRTALALSSSDRAAMGDASK